METAIEATKCGSSFMPVIYVILYGVFIISIIPTIFVVMPKILNWWELTISEDREENRVQKEVRELHKKLRVIRLIEEKHQLEETLSKKTGKEMK